jgi:hypothetical protein
MVLPWLVGQLFASFGAPVLLWLVNADLLIAAGLLLLLLGQARALAQATVRSPA